MGLSNIPIGAGKATWNSGDLGWTFGGGSISIEESATEIRADQYGTQVLNEYITGTKCEIKLNLTEVGVLTVMETFFPEGAVSGTQFPLNPNVGGSRLAQAKQLDIELLSDETTVEAGNTPNKYVFWLACSAGIYNITYDDWGKQKSAEITFHVYPDITSHSGALGYRGKV
jgi:hypothetical protein